jgi:hypothetical protein
MKKFLQLALVLFISFAAKAQQNYFVYVQTDNKQPFYIKLNEKIISSSAAGYLVIPKLTTGNYQLVVGFPKDQWTHQTFNIAIGTNDAGYLLKNFGEKGWGLYNIQTMEISMNGAPASSTTKTTAETDDVFAATLSGAANTNLTVQKENIPVPAKETPAPIIEATPTPIKTSTKSIIKKIKTIKEDDGKTVIYTDKHDGNIDTISIFIPAENKTIAKLTEVTSDVEIVKVAPIKDKKFLDIEMTNPNAEEKKEPLQKEESVSTPFVEHKAKKEESVSAPIVEPIIKKEELISTPFVEHIAKKEEPVSAPIVEPVTKKEEPVLTPIAEPAVKTEKPKLTFNSDCKASATEEDFLKARRKMVAEDNDDDMVDAVKKMFKLKCFTVEQIKNLSALLLNDAGKYKLFDAVYPFTSDTQNFESLQFLLKDEYFITRFKAMIRN